MSRVFVVVFVAAAAAAVQQTAVRANGSPMPAPSGGGPSASMPVVTPEQLAAQAYNSGISHKNKGLKLEADAEKATKDREKIRGKAKDEYGKALKDFKKALDLKPDAYQAFNGMGFALRKSGEPAKALEMYDKALALAPGFPDALEYRGEAYLALNRIDDARQSYLDLFGADRKQADILMAAMKSWVGARHADPAGVSPDALAAFEKWIGERDGLAKQTQLMAVTTRYAGW